MPGDERRDERVNAQSPVAFVVARRLRSEKTEPFEVLSAPAKMRCFDEFLKHFHATVQSHTMHAVGSAASGGVHVSALIASSHAASSSGVHDEIGIVAATRVVHRSTSS